ncbi:hypothetical protein IEQ34_013265 [Dendrobium chrysotoxum]|uniref:Uncharacterized protein n=1 Tax=Dendrobium chrysotoxum TaxID=161865 RepID=A0AAV7G7W8_DENCH|nr:hypothetical protein IEQ34_013265 [Dendrobium chrysotoxum]
MPTLPSTVGRKGSFRFVNVLWRWKTIEAAASVEATLDVEEGEEAEIGGERTKEGTAAVRDRESVRPTARERRNTAATPWLAPWRGRRFIKFDPFIIADHVRQVYFANYLSRLQGFIRQRCSLYFLEKNPKRSAQHMIQRVEKDFYWLPNHNDKIKKNFEKRGSTRMRDMFTDIRKKFRDDHYRHIQIMDDK